jgi:pilus assembly protein Flp/PilA
MLVAIGTFSRRGSKAPYLRRTVMKSILARLVRDEQGTETLEWGLVCGLIVIGAIVAITSIGPKVKAMWTNVDTAIK